MLENLTKEQIKDWYEGKLFQNAMMGGLVGFIVGTLAGDCDNRVGSNYWIDVNQDGRPDLVVEGHYLDESNSLAIYLQQEDGNYKRIDAHQIKEKKLADETTK